MKRILSIIVIICMMMTLAPVTSFALENDFSLTSAQTTYNAGIGETISVDFLMKPKSGTVTTQVVSFYVKVPDGLEVTGITGGKIPVSDSNGVNVANGKINVFYDGAITLSPSDATLFTVECTAETSGTYTLDIILDSIYDQQFELMGDSNNIDVLDATLTFKSAVETTTSTPVFVENFNYDSTYLTSDASPEANKELRTLAPEGFAMAGTIDKSGKYAYIVSNPDSSDATDGVLKFESKSQITSTGYETTNINRYITSDANSRYVMYSQKVKMGNWSTRFQIYTSHKDKVNGGINPDKSAAATNNTSNARLAFLLDGRNTSNTIKGGASGDGEISSQPTIGQFLNRWVDFVIIFDALNWQYTLYIDGMKVNTNPQSVNTTGINTSTQYISGISRVTFYHDKWSGTSGNSWYYDDLTVSSMTEGQYELFMAQGLTAPKEVYTGTTLPASENGIALTWTCDNDAVTINNNVVTVADGFYEYVNLTAVTPNGGGKTFKVRAGGLESKPDISKTSALVSQYSTQVFVENFNSIGKDANGKTIRELSDAGLGQNFSYSGTRDATYTDGLLPKISDSDYYFSVQNWKTGTASAYGYYYYSNMNAVTDTDYVIVSAKMKFDSGFRGRLYFGGLKKALNNGAYNPTGATSSHSEFVRLMIDNRSGNGIFQNEDNAGGSHTFAEAGPNSFGGEWTDVHFVFSAKDNTFTFYVNDVAFAKTSFKSAVGSGNYLAGISGIYLQDDKWGHSTVGAGVSIDDLKVRGMSAAQYEQFAVSAGINLPDVLYSGAQLPSTVAGYNVTWSCADDNASLNNGIITVKNGYFGDATLVATTQNGVSVNIKVKVCGEDLRPDISNVSKVISANSKRAYMQNFNEVGKANGGQSLRTLIDNGTISNEYGYSGSDSDSRTDSVFANVEGDDYAWKVYNSNNGTASAQGIFSHKNLNAICDTDYVVVSAKMKMEQGMKYRVYLTGLTKPLNNGEYNPTAAASSLGDMYYYLVDQRSANENEFVMEYYKPDGSNVYKPSEAKPLSFVGDWVDVHYIIEAKTSQIYMYYDNVLFAKIPMTKSAGNGNYIAGINAFTINVDKWGHGVKDAGIYIDDFQVRGMSLEQLNKVFIAGALPTVIKDGTTLPSSVADIQNITWSSESSSVTVTDGVVSVPDTFYGDVVFVATVDGVETEITAKAGLKPVYSSIEFGKTYNTVIGNMNVNGTKDATVDGVSFNNPIYYYRNNYYTPYHFGDDAFNIISKTSSDGITRYAAFSTTFIRNSSGGKGYGRLRINLDDFTTDYSNVWLEVDYLDTFTNESLRYYDVTDTDTEASKTVAVTGSNDNKWKTLRINITDAKFGSSANTKGELDLNGLKCVSAIRVYSATAADENGNVTIEIPESRQVKHAVHAITNDGTGKLYAEKEYTSDKACNVQVFIAVYDNVGDLKTVVASPETAFAAGETKTISTNLTAKEFDTWQGDKLKFFVWYADDLTPLE